MLCVGGVVCGGGVGPLCTLRPDEGRALGGVPATWYSVDIGSPCARAAAGNEINQPWLHAMKQRRATHAQSRQRPEPSTAGRLGRPRRLEPVSTTRPAWRSPTSGFLRLRSRPSHCSSRTVVWSGTKRCVVQNSRGHVGQSPDPVPTRCAHPPYAPPRAGCRWSSSTNRGLAVYRFNLSRG